MSEYHRLATSLMEMFSADKRRIRDVKLNWCHRDIGDVA